MSIDLSKLRLDEQGDFSLDSVDPGATPGDRAAFEERFEEDVARLQQYQTRFRAEEKTAFLVVLMAVDTGGKDPTIDSVLEKVALRGIRVEKFDEPSPVEAAHDFLWRHHQKTPKLGELAIFNRSHYDAMVEPVMDGEIDRDEFRSRLGHVPGFERLLHSAPTVIRKFFFHISREEQGRRVAERIEDPEKQHEFDVHDVETHERWGDYHELYEEAIGATATEWAPWHVVPANEPWVRNGIVARVLVEAMEEIDPEFPDPDEDPTKYRDRLTV